ncbi:VOC family protein [Cupriavidus gilardii]|uniref:VOC family protein n=1 Tax=Cupriavidus gilardii TaxID=82541 RepID=UPI0007E3BC4F|nr:VOC family protein [Cupriavidus gilardii]
MQNVLINWLEIPVVDMARAVQFYERVFETKLRRETMSEIDMAIFPHSHSGGALVAGEGFKPSTEGSLPYLHTPALNDLLARVAGAGGKTVFGPMELPDDIGRIAHIIDSEGNKIGLHEPVPANR